MLKPSDHVFLLQLNLLKQRASTTTIDAKLKGEISPIKAPSLLTMATGVCSTRAREMAPMAAKEFRAFVVSDRK
ncbi:hypothetical protein V6N13_131664 [Hibiscus sabdariffa]|uniref:Uncharacterized protein n=1 Tax=Hibiscus sabdariffa TaxID=183260 RepID=A0ABR2DA94_9ROSI